MSNILLIEDDDLIGKALKSALESHRFDVIWAQLGADARSAVRARSFDLVLLDLGLPDIDGVDLCRHLRAAQPSSVIVILTARDEEIDVIVGLEAGADDYLTKPLRLTELLARVRAHLRRATASPATEVSRVGELVVDTTSRRAWIAEQELVLRPKEFDLLARLAAQPDAAISRETLMSEIWDEHWYGSTKTLDVHVAALRRKLSTTADGIARPPQIVTLRGVGFRLESEQNH